MPLVAVALGGAAGALLRWGLAESVDAAAAFPWVTFAINVAGCFVLAALPAVGAVRRSPGWTLFLGPGVLGGFTTVSSWAHESRALAADGRRRPGRVVRRRHAGRLRRRGSRGPTAGRGRAMTALLVALGAAVGAPLRYLWSQALDDRWPLGTLLVNVVGSGLAGMFAALSFGDHAWALP